MCTMQQRAFSGMRIPWFRKAIVRCPFINTHFDSKLFALHTIRYLNASYQIWQHERESNYSCDFEQRYKGKLIDAALFSIESILPFCSSIEIEGRTSTTCEK